MSAELVCGPTCKKTQADVTACGWQLEADDRMDPSTSSCAPAKAASASKERKSRSFFMELPFTEEEKLERGTSTATGNWCGRSRHDRGHFARIHAFTVRVDRRNHVVVRPRRNRCVGVSRDRARRRIDFRVRSAADRTAIDII